jgi:Tol biopolymer transport system component
LPASRLTGRLLLLAAILITPGLEGSAVTAEAATSCGTGISHDDLLAYVVETDAPTHLVTLSSTFDIWTIRGDGTGARRLTTTGSDTSPEFSPDGARIAFESRRAGQADIWVMNVDGSDQHAVTATPDIREGQPTWSPDGAQIAFHSSPITTLNLANPDIEVIDADGTSRRNLTNTPLAKDVKPHWSPNGSKIVFEAGSPAIATAAPNDDIWVMNADGSHRRRLTSEPGREWFPQWSPDGQHIAFMSGRDGNFEIYVMRANGSAETRLTSSLAEDGHPTWSPDGSRIVFETSNALLLPLPGVFVSTPSTRGSLTAIRPDGSDPVRIVRSGLPSEPDYRPCPT